MSARRVAAASSPVEVGTANVEEPSEKRKAPPPGLWGPPGDGEVHSWSILASDLPRRLAEGQASTVREACESYTALSASVRLFRCKRSPSIGYADQPDTRSAFESTSQK